MKRAHIGAVLNFDLCDLQKVGKIKNSGNMSCILIRCTYDKNLEMIQPLVQELALFVFVAKPRIRLDRNLVCELLLPSGIYLQSFGSMAPVVTKRTLLTDDIRHVIA
jgi:hypothetical protein